MLINGNPTVDPYDLLEIYAAEGLSTDLIGKCNSQQFRFIDGAGEGYFLVTDNHYTSAETVTLTFPNLPNSRDVRILDVTKLAAPSDPSRHYLVLHTAEAKYNLNDDIVVRNYNVIHRRTLYGSEVAILAPDATPKTLQQIINDFTGTTCVYVAPTIYPYDVFIQGMTYLEAIDRLCAAYGLLWVYHNNIIGIYSVVTPTTIDYSRLNDISHTLQPIVAVATEDEEEILLEDETPLTTESGNVIADFNVVYPVLDCCQQYPDPYYSVGQNTNSPGKSLKVFMPYFPATIDLTRTVTNNTMLMFIENGLLQQYEAIYRMQGSYRVHNEYFIYDLTAKPTCFAVMYGDLGSGPRTIFSSQRYPFLPVPIPPSIDRQAKNWLGYLLEEYKGSRIGFWVVPAFGLDGQIPSEDQYVINIYAWNYGALGATVRVEWDCVNYRWIALQQEYVCPPSEEPPEPTPPPEQPSYGDISNEGSWENW